MGIKENLNLILKNKAMTLPQLAKASGVPKSTLHSWSEQKSLNIDQLRAVANILQVSIHQLMFGESDPYEQSAKEILTEIFSGDVRVTLHKIEKKK